tara:strand:+ start:29931 stop:30950 length:1020 start_codon:yes stop_codon:yes gene_type:complete
MSKINHMKLITLFKLNKLRISILFTFLSLIFYSCLIEDQKDNTQKVNIEVPNFSPDSAYHFIETQVNFGPRVISSKSWENCAIWLEKEFKKYTPHLIIQEAPVTTYDGKKHVLKNFIASFSPEKKNRVVLFAHWDSRHIADHDTINQEMPILGANDGGSGVGVLLEIARILKANETKIGVDIILFDAEDYGQPENSGFPIQKDTWCLGSQYWSKNLHKKNYYARFGILLDMVGGKNAKFYLEGNSSYYAKNILKKVWKKGHQLGYEKYFIYKDSPEIMDDHLYVNYYANIPTIDIIEYDPLTENNFNKHWHTHQDNMDNIDKRTLKAVGNTILHIIYNE